jgi:hypothetical protein
MRIPLKPRLTWPADRLDRLAKASDAYRPARYRKLVPVPPKPSHGRRIGADVRHLFVELSATSKSNMRQ